MKRVFNRIDTETLGETIRRLAVYRVTKRKRHKNETLRQILPIKDVIAKIG